MTDRLVGPISLETILKQAPPKRETYDVVVGKGGEKYVVESMVSRLRDEKTPGPGKIVYVVPGSTRYFGAAPAPAKTKPEAD